MNGIFDFKHLSKSRNGVGIVLYWLESCLVSFLEEIVAFNHLANSPLSVSMHL